MGSLSEFFDYINEERYMKDEESLHVYSYITVTNELRKIRNKYRKLLKEKKKQGDLEKLF